MIKIILIRMSFLLCEPKNCWKEGFILIAVTFQYSSLYIWGGSIALHSKSYSERSALSVASDRNLFSRVQNFLLRINLDVDTRISIVLIIQILKQLSLSQQHSTIQLIFFQVWFRNLFQGFITLLRNQT